MAALVVIALVGCEDSSSLRSRGAIQTDGGGGNAGVLASGGVPSGGTVGNGGSIGAPPSSGGTGGSGGTIGAGGMTIVYSPNSHCAVGDTALYNDVSLNTVNCDGLTHRVSQNACAPRPPSDYVLPPSGLKDECRRDGDCTGAANGHCNQSSGGGGRSGNSCSYDCLTDADCGGYGVCDCIWDQCESATCRTDADCPAGKLCLKSVSGYDASGALTNAYHCQSSNDTCTGSSGSCGQGYQCLWNGDHLACTFLPIP